MSICSTAEKCIGRLDDVSDTACPDCGGSIVDKDALRIEGFTEAPLKSFGSNVIRVREAERYHRRVF